MNRFFYIAQALREDNTFLGVIFYQVKSTLLKALISDFSSLGKSGEIIFLNFEDMDLIIQNRLRLDIMQKGKKLELADIDDTTQWTKMNQSSYFGHFDDYRGVDSLLI